MDLDGRSSFPFCLSRSQCKYHSSNVPSGNPKKYLSCDWQTLLCLSSILAHHLPILILQLILCNRRYKYVLPEIFLKVFEFVVLDFVCTVLCGQIGSLFSGFIGTLYCTVQGTPCGTWLFLKIIKTTRIPLSFKQKYIVYEISIRALV